MRQLSEENAGKAKMLLTYPCLLCIISLTPPTANLTDQGLGLCVCGRSSLVKGKAATVAGVRSDMEEGMHRWGERQSSGWIRRQIYRWAHGRGMSALVANQKTLLYFQVQFSASIGRLRYRRPGHVQYRIL